MGKYLHKFDSPLEYNQALENYTEPWVSTYEYEGETVVNYNSKDYALMPFTIESLYGSTYTINRSDLRFGDFIIVYNGTEINVENGGSINLEIKTGDKIQIFKITNVSHGLRWFIEDLGFRDFKVYGNIMSLIYGKDFRNKNYFPENTIENFQDLFNYAWYLKDASNLILPVTNLTEGCYNDMFYRAERLEYGPTLPATTLVNYCYRTMFDGCIKLKHFKCLATDISATNCTSSWLRNVNSTGTIVCPSSTQWTTGESGIPTGWTRVDA